MSAKPGTIPGNRDGQLNLVACFCIGLVCLLAACSPAQEPESTDIVTRLLLTRELAKDYSGADITRFALHDPAEVTTYGFVFNGVNYSGGCPTRFGPYPYCDSFALPSYLLAKTIFAASVAKSSGRPRHDRRD